MALSIQERIKDLRLDRGLTLEQLAEHPDFVKLMTDIQIYVEGLAATQIQNLNAWVDVARAEVMEKYQPGEHDKNMYLLQAAHIDEGDYFSMLIKSPADLENFKTMYGIDEEIAKEY